MTKQARKLRRKRDLHTAKNLHDTLTPTPQRVTRTTAYKRWLGKMVVGWTLVSVGGIVAISHVFEHLADVRLVAYQDLLIGWPMAGVLAVAGLFVLTR
jgi:hypothetical protein